MNTRFAKRKMLLRVLLFVTTLQARAQSPQKTAPPDELFRTIASFDSALFEVLQPVRSGEVWRIS